MRVDVKFRDLTVLDAFAFPMSVIGLDAGDICLPSCLKLFDDFVLRDPLCARHVVIGKGGGATGHSEGDRERQGFSSMHRDYSQVGLKA